MTESFRFGNVNGPVVAGTGNTVAGGDQYIAGRDLASTTHIGADPELAAVIMELRNELASLHLTDAERADAERRLDAVEQARDKKEGAGRFGAFVSGLEQAGALATAGTRLLETLRTVAVWLGPLAAGVLTLL